MMNTKNFNKALTVICLVLILALGWAEHQKAELKQHLDSFAQITSKCISQLIDSRANTFDLKKQKHDSI